METLIFKFDQGDKEVLLRHARNTVRKFLAEDIETESPADSDRFSAKLGAFVSIHTITNELRGCIGKMKSEKPLYQLIAELSLSAASKDYRFSPIRKSELNTIFFEISVLSPLQRIHSPEEIIGGKHGIYIKKGNQSGTFLPQVFSETGWDIDTFVGKCSRDKAGIGWDGWKEAELYIYTAEIFSEKDPKTK